MAKKIIAANWKEHPQSFSAAAALFRATAKAQRSGFDAIVCPPAIYLRELGRIGKRYSEISYASELSDA